MLGLSTVRQIDDDLRLPYALHFKVRHRARRSEGDAKIERWLVAAPEQQLTAADYRRLQRRGRRIVLLSAAGLLVAALVIVGLAWQGSATSAAWIAPGVVAVLVAAIALNVLLMLWVDRHRPPGPVGLLPVRSRIRPVSAIIVASPHWYELTRVVDLFTVGRELDAALGGATAKLREEISAELRGMLWEAASVPAARLEAYAREVLPVRARDAAVLRYIYEANAEGAAVPAGAW